jgi:hypothetical protein
VSTRKTLSIVAASALAGSSPSHFSYVERHKERFAFSQRDENLGRRLSPKRDSFLSRVVHLGTANLQSPAAASSATGFLLCDNDQASQTRQLLKLAERARVSIDPNQFLRGGNRTPSIWLRDRTGGVATQAPPDTLARRPST